MKGDQPQFPPHAHLSGEVSLPNFLHTRRDKRNENMSSCRGGKEFLLPQEGERGDSAQRDGERREGEKKQERREEGRGKELSAHIRFWG